MTHITKDAALEYALKTFERISEEFHIHQMDSAVSAIKQAIAAPVQEPVAWEDGPHLVVRSDMRERLNYKGPWVDMGRAIPDKWVPVLYATPPAATVPDLTHDQWDEWQDKHGLILEREALNELRSILYTAPPAAQRQWVGLTDDEFEDIEMSFTPTNKIGAMMAVEAKLKEKNT